MPRAYLFVPNYDGTGVQDGSPHSYLILGVVGTEPARDGTTATWPGGDLLKAAGFAPGSGFFMDDDAVGNRGQRNQQTAGTTYHRYRSNGAKDTLPWASGNPAQTLTDELVTRGGWRDHTDGNRIVTTRGDRVDFVQGNYKRVVFGRVTGDKVGVSTWESSGGHNHDSTSTPGEVMSISWVDATYSNSQLPREGKTWRVVERTEEGNQINRYSGVVVDRYYGPYQRSVIGKWPSPNPLPAPNQGVEGVRDHASWTTPGYPALTEARSATTDDFPVIDEITYATSITSTTTLDTSTEKTTALGKISGTTLAHTIESDTGSAGQRISSIEEHQAVDTLTSQEFYGFKFDLSVGGTASSESCFHTLSLGASALKLEVMVGATAELKLGVVGVEIDLTAIKLETGIAASLEVLVGANLEYTIQKKELKVNGDEVKLTKADLTMQKLRTGVVSTVKALSYIRL